jgi:hypothetical protein
MSFVSEYNLGRDASTTYFLASLVCFPWDAVLRCLFRLPHRQERQHTVRNVGMHTSCAVAGHPIIPLSFHRCQAPVAKPLVLSQHSCQGTHFMLLFAHARESRCAAFS